MSNFKLNDLKYSSEKHKKGRIPVAKSTKNHLINE